MMAPIPKNNIYGGLDGVLSLFNDGKNVIPPIGAIIDGVASKEKASMLAAGYWSIDGFSIKTDNLDDNFLLNKNELNSFAAKRNILDKYFQDLFDNYSSMSRDIFTALAEININLMDEHKGRLDKASSPKEAMSVLESIYSAEVDKSKKSLIRALIEIEDKNERMRKAYLEMASRQNPIIRVLRNFSAENPSVDEYFGIGKMNETLIYEFRKRNNDLNREELEIDMGALYNEVQSEYPEHEILADLKKVKEIIEESGGYDVYNTPEIQERMPQKFKKYFFEYYYNKLGTNGVTSSYENIVWDVGSIEKDIAVLEKKKAKRKLEAIHIESASMSRELIYKSFYEKGNTTLSELIPSYSQMINKPTNEEKVASVEQFRSAIVKGIENMDRHRLESLSITKRELQDIAVGEFEKFWEPGSVYANAIMRIDDQTAAFVQKGVPPGEAQEAAFQKILNDLIYNKVFEKIGGKEAYEEFVGQGKVYPQKGIIDIEKNLDKDAYLDPIKNEEFRELYEDAIDMHNIKRMFKGVKSGELSRGTVEEVMKSMASDISSESKAAISENLDNFYKTRKITMEDIGKSPHGKTSEQEIQDFISAKNAKKLEDVLYRLPLLSRIGRSFGIISQSSANLISCLKKASSPAISSHSTTSETRACIDEHQREIQQKIDSNLQNYSNPLAAILGLVVVLAVVDHFRQTKLIKISFFKLETLNDETKSKIFVSQGKDDIEKVFRANTIETKRNVITSDVIGKDVSDEYIFKTIKGHHDYELFDNMFLGAGNEKVQELPEMRDIGLIGSSVKNGIFEIFDKIGERESFLSFVEKHNKELNQKYEAKYIVTKVSLDIASKINKKIKDSDSTENIVNFLSDSLESSVKNYLMSTVGGNKEAYPAIENIDNVDTIIETLLMVEDDPIVIKGIVERIERDIEFYKQEAIAKIKKSNSMSDKMKKERLIALENAVSNMEQIRVKLISEIDQYEKYKESPEKHPVPAHKKELYDAILITKKRKGDDLGKSFSRHTSDMLTRFQSIVEEGVKTGGLPPSKIEKIFSKIANKTRKMSELLENDINRIKDRQEEIKIKLADISQEINKENITVEEKKQLIELKKDFISEEKKIINELSEKIKEKSLAVDNFMHYAEMLGKYKEAESVLQRNIKQSPAFIAFGKLIAGEGTEDIQPLMVDKLFSQKVFLSGMVDVGGQEMPLFDMDALLRKVANNSLSEQEKEYIDLLMNELDYQGLNKKDFLLEYKDEIQGNVNQTLYSMRMANRFADGALFEDLSLFDEFNKHIHASGKISRTDSTVSEAIAAAKVLFREGYFSAEQTKDGTKSREEVFEKLFTGNREKTISTAEVALSMVEQEDGKHIEVIKVDKTQNPENIVSATEAIAILTHSLSDDILQQKINESGYGEEIDVKNLSSEEKEAFIRSMKASAAQHLYRLSRVTVSDKESKEPANMNELLSGDMSWIQTLSGIVQNFPFGAKIKQIKNHLDEEHKIDENILSQLVLKQKESNKNEKTRKR